MWDIIFKKSIFSVIYKWLEAAARLAIMKNCLSRILRYEERILSGSTSLKAEESFARCGKIEAA